MKAVAALRLQSGRADSRLEADQREDLARLASASATLEALLTDSDAAAGAAAGGVETDGGADAGAAAGGVETDGGVDAGGAAAGAADGAAAGAAGGAADGAAASQWQHDIRNALNAVQGYAELLLEEPDKLRPPLRASLESIVGEVASAITNGATDSHNLEQGASIGNMGDSATGSAGNGTTTDTAPKGRILVVDDSADNRDLLARHLNLAGHRVLSASSGEEALTLLANGKLDLVLLDLIMPGMGGGEVLTRIKANDALRPIPVIMISGQQDMDGIISCIEAGADDYLFKPFNPVLLQARIKAGLERKRWHDREEQYLTRLERSQQFIRATFGRYVSDEVVQNLLEKPEGLELGGDLREVTMLMSDIRQFSSICEQLPPDGVMKMLNNYLGKMSEIIIGYQGTIDEFIGDAVFAIFGAPVSREDDADRAVQCALDMQKAMRDINRDNLKAGLPEISMGIGVNTGKVVAGNIGSEQRSKYGVVGHHVNMTARIESQASGGEILVSGSTLDKLSAPRSTGPMEQVKVKGIRETVSIHRLTGIDP